MNTRSDIIYRVNERDEIVFVNEAWDSFAVVNSGGSVTSSKVVRRPLWDFIADSTTRELYRQILKRVREGGSIRFPLRCDSPKCRRLLVMEVGYGDDGAVEFRTRTISEENREGEPRSAANVQGRNGPLRQCGWCKKIFINGAWQELEKAVEQLRLFEHASGPSITHGICEHCRDTMLETLAQS